MVLVVSPPSRHLQRATRHFGSLGFPPSNAVFTLTKVSSKCLPRLSRQVYGGLAMGFLGIDLGTTFSAMATLGRDGQPDVIANAEGELTTPSVVLFDSETEIIVGREARRVALAEPELVAEDIKRHMGDRCFPRLIGGREYSPVMLSALILRKLKQDAARRLGEVEAAVITVPAYFDEGRRQATAEAGRQAGLRVLDLLNEPTAAALAYAFQQFLAEGGEASDLAEAEQRVTRARTSVVYDLGGGTFDVTVLRFEPGQLQVLATAGDVQLGGRDWDSRLADHLASEFLKQHQADPRDDAMGRQHLMQVAEELKKELSTRQRARYVVGHGGRQLSGQLTREQFETLTGDLLFRTESRLNRVLQDAGVRWTQVDEVLTVGGSTRMPQVAAMLERVTGRQPNTSLSPDEAVAQGAAVHAAMCLAKGTTASAASSAPAAAAAASGQLPEPSDADAVAPVTNQSHLLARLGEKVTHLLRTLRTSDVNAHSLGVVATKRDGQQVVSVMIPRNTSLPAKVTRCFGTQRHDQRRVSVQVVEGEADDPKACLLVGTCHIMKLPERLPKGSPVEVTFQYDGSGRLHVEAVHLPSGSWAETLIERQAGVSPERIHLNREMLARMSVA